MMREVKVMILTLFLISILAPMSHSLHVQPVLATATADVTPEESSNAKSICNPADGRIVKSVFPSDVVEHIATSFELEKLKTEIGVWKEGNTYNQIIGDHGTGLRPPTEKEWATIAKETPIVDRIIVNQAFQSPSKIDHTTEPWFPPIGNQYEQGSCTVWAVGYYMKTYQEAKEHGWDLSKASWEEAFWEIYGGGHPTAEYQDRIMSPSFVYNLINGGTDGGSSPRTAINLIGSIGACSWSKMPYDTNDYTSWPSKEAWQEAPLYRGENGGGEYMQVTTDAELASLKTWIASGNLAVIGVDANKLTNGLWSLLTSNDALTLDNYQNPSINHENTIVGYDDTIEYSEGGVACHGAFKIANSWGKSIWLLRPWENVPDGCYWISYETMKQRIGYCQFCHDRVGYEPELVASFQLIHPKRGECILTVGVENQTKWFNDYVDGGFQPFCSNEILFDITEFKKTMPDIGNKTFFLKAYDWGNPTTGTITKFAIECAQSNETPINTVNNKDVYVNVTFPPIGTSVRSAYFESAFTKPQSGHYWFSISDDSSWSGTVMKSSVSSPSGSWLYGPYITAGWDGENMLRKPYVATFRLKVSSNQSMNDAVCIDVAYNAGEVLQSMRIKASDFASPNVWQDFHLAFVVPYSMAYGLEFRVENLNNNVADVYIDYLSVSRGWAAPTIYSEGAYNKPWAGGSWSNSSDSSSLSGLVMKASSLSPNGGILFGPYITIGWDKTNVLGKPYVATFRLRASYNWSTNAVVRIDVAYNAGYALHSMMIKSSDFVSSNVWQDFNLSLTVPRTLTAGLEFRVQNWNNGITDLYVDKITVTRACDTSIVYFEGASNKQQSGSSWSKISDSSSFSGFVMSASASSSNGGCLYGPYIISSWAGESMLGKAYTATLRLRVSSNQSTSNVVYIDVCYNYGTVLHSMRVRACDFNSSNLWQDFEVPFIVPGGFTAGLEFRLINLNNGVADVAADEISVTKDVSIVYWEGAYGKPQSGNSWIMVSDPSSWSSMVMKAPASSPNGGCLFGPYITRGWNQTSMLGKSYVATFRLKISPNVLGNDVAYVDVAYNAGTVLQSMMIKAGDFASPNTWQDFTLAFITPSSLTAGLEFRVTNWNNGAADVYFDTITVKQV